MKFQILSLVVVMGLIGTGLGAPLDQPEDDGQYHKDQEYQPAPYDYTYTVTDPPTKNYYGHEEKGTEAGRTEGKYFVWLPDGRLQTVTYYVDSKSGYVPTITYSDGTFNPFS